MLQAGVEADTAIQNSVMRVAKQQGQSPAQLEEYLIRLHKLGLTPDERTFNVLLRAYVAHGNLSDATRILERMGAQGVAHMSLSSHTAAFTCSCVLSLLCTCLPQYVWFLLCSVVLGVLHLVGWFNNFTIMVSVKCCLDGILQAL